MSEDDRAPGLSTEIVLRCVATVGGVKYHATQQIPRSRWDELPEDGREFFRAEVRRKLVEIIVDRLNPEVTEHDWVVFPEPEDEGGA